MPMNPSVPVRLPRQSAPVATSMLALPLMESPQETDHRKTLALRAVQWAMAAMVAVAVAGALITGDQELRAARLGLLLSAALAYIVWSLYSTRDVIQYALWHHGASPPPPFPSPGRLRPVVHIAIQFVLAEAIVALAGPLRSIGLLWLVLLPPIGQSIMFLRWPGIMVVAVLSVALHTANVAWWHGWAPVPLALPGFSVAVLFTLAFTQITVSAEKARGEVERLAAELNEANGQLREYALQAEELAATRERNRMAREIHDSLGHCLTVVHVQLEAARATFDRNPVHALEALGKAQKVAQTGLSDIRRSVAALRVSPLHDRPLAEAIGQLVSESQSTGLAAHAMVQGRPRPLPPQAELTLYRAAQEGLTNCRKHAQATTASVLLDFQSEGVVRLAVTDNGVGAADTSQGFGLLGLRERAQLLGGQIRVRTAPGEGFSLEVEVPG